MHHGPVHPLRLKRIARIKSHFYSHDVWCIFLTTVLPRAVLTETHRQDNAVDIERFRTYFLGLIDDTSASSPKARITSSNVSERGRSRRIERNQEALILPRLSGSLEIGNEEESDTYRRVKNVYTGKRVVFAMEAGGDSSGKTGENLALKDLSQSCSTLRDARAPPWEGSGRGRA